MRILNKFGHAISYDKAQRYITSIAEQTDLNTIEAGIFIPSSLVPGQFTQCTLDNLDFNEDTKDGSTMHATSHNIYQAQHDDRMDQGILTFEKKSEEEQ